MSGKHYKKYGTPIRKTPEEQFNSQVHYDFHMKERMHAMSLDVVSRLERFCGCNLKESVKARKERQIKQYGLVYRPNLNSYDAENREATFAVFQQKFAKAREYPSLNALLYAMKFGTTPVTIYYSEETGSHDCKRPARSP